MNKKITKTIMSLIVFVVFLGIVGLEHVEAVRSECIYKFGDSGIKISINNDGGLTERTIFDDKQNFIEYLYKNDDTLEVRNWGARYEGFSGASYYLNNGHKCPPRILYIYKMTKHTIIFSDATTEYENHVQIALNAEDFDNSSVTSAVGNFLDYTFSTHIPNLFGAGIDDSKTHILYEYDLESQTDSMDPDPEDEVVYDDGHEREWDDPSVRPVNPLDEEKITYSCGTGMLTGIPSRIPKFGKFLYNFMQFLIPIALVLVGTIDLIKALVGSKEDDIKKHQSIFIKRLISSAVVFFSFAIIKLILSMVAEDSANIIGCVDCILRNSSSCIREN